ncbi:MAG: S1C family serine protease [Thermoguttaceae bacterium]
MRTKVSWALFFSVVLVVIGSAQESQQSRAIRKGVREIAPWIVQIEVIGGPGNVQGGRTTGVLWDSQGFVLTSAVPVLEKPTSILIRLNDGTRTVARKIATDRLRQLVLLKIENFNPQFFPGPLPVLGKETIQVGQRTIAVGSVLSESERNVSLGIISGKARIWGKAIQTDAKISPNNYGGVLLDLQGQVLGVIVPLSIMPNDPTFVVQQYDSGIGFAIPIEDVRAMIPRLQQGKDLEPYESGIIFDDIDLYTGDAVIEQVQPGSPAFSRGLKKGDRIVKINGQTVDSAREAQTILGMLYRDDPVDIEVDSRGATSQKR